MEELLKAWLREYQGDFRISRCAAGCAKLQFTYRWFKRRRFCEAEAGLLSLLLANTEGLTVLTYWDDPAPALAAGSWVKLPDTDNSWIVPGDVNRDALLSELYKNAWLLYHITSRASPTLWNLSSDASLESVCRSMTASRAGRCKPSGNCAGVNRPSMTPSGGTP
jgi:hypothetical protein